MQPFEQISELLAARLYRIAFTALAIIVSHSAMAENASENSSADTSDSPSTPLIVQHVTPLSPQDKRHDYGIELLRLALAKTVKDFGPFETVGAPRMNQARGMESVRENRYPNLVRTFGYEARFEKEMDMVYAKFPIHMGIVGYRVCFIPENIQNDLFKVNSYEQLKKYVHGQGRGWADAQILRYNGFEVKEIAEYESLFGMAALGRVQLFCRGVNEVFDEYIHNHKIKNLALDQAIIIFYPLPRFYYSHKSNKDLIKRIEVGLVRAYSDGSIGQLWEKHYRRSLDFVNIRARRFFYFDSPLVEGIDFDYQQYFVSLKSDFYDHEPPARNISSQQPLH